MTGIEYIKKSVSELLGSGFGGHEAEPIKKDNLIERRVWINTR